VGSGVANATSRVVSLVAGRLLCTLEDTGKQSPRASSGDKLAVACLDVLYWAATKILSQVDREWQAWPANGSSDG
jgi:hypothetical protein